MTQVSLCRKFKRMYTKCIQKLLGQIYDVSMFSGYKANIRNSSFVSAPKCWNMKYKKSGNEITEMIPKAQPMKEITDKLDFINIQSFCSDKTMSRELANKPQTGRNDF